MISQRIKSTITKSLSKTDESIFKKIKRLFIRDKEYEKILNYKEMFNGNYSGLTHLQSFFENKEASPLYNGKMEMSVEDFFNITNSGSTARSALIATQLIKDNVMTKEYRYIDTKGNKKIENQYHNIPNEYLEKDIQCLYIFEDTKVDDK